MPTYSVDYLDDEQPTPVAALHKELLVSFELHLTANRNRRLCPDVHHVLQTLIDHPPSVVVQYKVANSLAIQFTDALVRSDRIVGVPAK